MKPKGKCKEDCGWEESPIIEMPPKTMENVSFKKIKFKLPNLEDLRTKS